MLLDELELVLPSGFVVVVVVVVVHLPSLQVVVLSRFTTEPSAFCRVDDCLSPVAFVGGMQTSFPPTVPLSPMQSVFFGPSVGLGGKLQAMPVYFMLPPYVVPPAAVVVLTDIPTVPEQPDVQDLYSSPGT